MVDQPVEMDINETSSNTVCFNKNVDVNFNYLRSKLRTIRIYNADLFFSATLYTFATCNLQLIFSFRKVQIKANKAFRDFLFPSI